VNWENAILMFVTLIISLTVHEASHALLAKWGGDRTAYYGGQVTLNPLPHIQREPFGMVVLPLIALALSHGYSTFGFAHAPYDPVWAYHNPRKSALMAAAGPLSNALLAAIAFAVLWYVGRADSGTEEAVRRIAGAFFTLNLLLGVFNLIPVPPLDGTGIVSGLVPSTRRFYDSLQRIPYFSIVIFVLLINYVPVLFRPVFWTVNGWLPYPLGR